MKTLKKRLLAALLALCVLLLSGCSLKDLQWFMAQLQILASDEADAPEGKPEEGAPPERAPLSEAEIDEIDGQVQAQLSAMKQAEAEFLEEDGTVLPENAQAAIDSVAAYAAEALERGELASYLQGEDGVAMTLPSGIPIFYAPTIQGMMSGGSSTEAMSFVTFEPFKGTVVFDIFSKMGNPETLQKTVERIARQMDPTGQQYQYNTHLAGGEADIDALKNLPSRAVIMLFGHGSYNAVDGSIFLSGEQYQKSTLDEYFDDYLERRMLIFPSGALAVDAAFFEKYYDDGALEDDLIILACCVGFKSDELAETLLKKGADAVTGFEENIYDPVLSEALRATLEGLAEGKPLFASSTLPIRGNREYSFITPFSFNALSEARSRELESHTSILDTARIATHHSGDFSYYLVGDEAVLMDYSGSARRLAVPQEIDGHSVLAIGQKCFAGNVDLEEVVIPNSIQALHAYAFCGCPGLRRLTIGRGVSSIGYHALEGAGPLSAASLSRAYDPSDTEHSAPKSTMTICVYEDSYAEQWCTDRSWPDEFVEIDHPIFAGPVVDYDGSLYYWRYSSDSFSDECWRYNTDVSFHDTNLFASYMPLPEARNELVRHQRNGEEQVLLTANGCGNIAIPPSGDRIYFQYPTNSNGSKAIASVDMNGENREDFGDGSILGATSNGETILCSWQNNIGMCIIRDGRHQIIDRFGTFLLAADGRIFYDHSEDGDQKVTSIAEDGSDALEIFSIHPPYDRSRECCQPVVRGDSLYFSYGEVSNGGNFAYVGGKIIRAKLDGSGWEIVAGENDDAAREFLVNPWNWVIHYKVDDPVERRIPMNEYYTRRGSVFISSGEGKPRELISPVDYGVLGPGNCNTPEPTGFLCIDTGNFVVETGGHVYFLVQYGTVDLEKSDDWFTTYHLQKSAMLDKDQNTGEVTVMFTF